MLPQTQPPLCSEFKLPASFVFSVKTRGWQKICKPAPVISRKLLSAPTRPAINLYRCPTLIRRKIRPIRWNARELHYLVFGVVLWIAVKKKHSNYSQRPNPAAAETSETSGRKITGSGTAGRILPGRDGPGRSVRDLNRPL